MENNIKSKKGNKVIKAAMFGSLAGVVTGLLLAPKSGLELRQDLAVQAHEIGDKAVVIRDKTQSAWQNVEDKTQVAVNTGKSLIHKGKRLVSNLKILVYEIQHGALTKTVSINASESELVQLKLNIETSVGESTPTEAEYGSPLPLVEVGVLRLDKDSGEPTNDIPIIENEHEF